MHHLYILRSGEVLPLLLPLPPTSLTPMNDFLSMAFASRYRASYGSVVEIGLRRMDNGHLYSVATFKLLHDFAGPQLQEIRAYTQDFKDMIKERHTQLTTAANTSPLDYVYAQESPAAIGGANGFSPDDDLPSGPAQLAPDLPFGPAQPAQLAPDLPFGPSDAEQPVPDLSFGPADTVQPAPSEAFEIVGTSVLNGDKDALPA